jgi:hypothetical protein
MATRAISFGFHCNIPKNLPTQRRPDERILSLGADERIPPSGDLAKNRF